MRFRDFLEIDFILLLSVIILLILGILFIYSSGVTSSGAVVSNEYVKQIIWASSGVIIALILSAINYRKFYDISLYMYLISLLPLIYTFIFGRVVHSSRWLRIGSFGIQTSEFAKLTVIILLARYLSDTERGNKSTSRFFGSCMIVFIPMGIVLLQPDLGTSLVFIAILLSMTFAAGISMKYLVFMGLCIGFTGMFLVLPLWQTYIYRKTISALSILTNPKFIIIVISFLSLISVIALFGYLKYKKRYFFWVVYTAAILIFSLTFSYGARYVLKQYQLMRLIVFLDPNVDPRGAGWNIIQSITAIGAGGLMGRGYLKGTQSHYRYLPEQSTDFIFSIFSEETGFLGGILVFALFLIIFQRLLRIMKTASDSFAVYICAGLAGMFSFHFLINVGMTMGIMPITGIPLLFMSYGGSAAFTAMIGIGLALSINIRRYNR
jgi:rod shape determining protein RodA